MLLVLALAVFFSPEALSEPFFAASSADCPAAAVASNGDATFLAWAQAERPWPAVGKFAITTTLLDTTLIEIPGRRAQIVRERRPLCVDAAFGASDIVMVWSEEAAQDTSDDVYSATFRVDGTPILAARLIASIEPTMHPRIVWQPAGGGKYFLLLGNRWIESASAELLSTLGAAAAHFYESVAATSATFAVSGRVIISGGTPICTIPGYRCGTTPSSASVVSAQPYWAQPVDIHSSPRDPISRTTIACRGDRCSVFWMRPVGEATFELANFTDRELTNVLIPLEHGTSASGLVAGSDGHAILLVWESGPVTARRISGSIMTGSQPGEPFVIAEGSGARRRPEVIALGRNRFLVAYELNESSGLTRLGGRLVLLEPSRRRAVR